MHRNEIKKETVYHGGLPTHSPRLVTEVENDSVTFRLESRRSRTGWTRIQYVLPLDEFAEWARKIVPQPDKLRKGAD